MPPTQIGAYPIERVLGQGGAGAVYLGRHPGSGVPVAIKTVLAGRSASPHLLQRFQAEAQALTRLRHPNLVPLLDVGTDRGVPFLVLEYVPGQTLEDRLREQGPLTAAQAAESIRSLASAVHYAHICQVVHRDLKPANVLLRPTGEVVLTDFGLALHLDAEGRLSTSGVCLGTPGFWSPEQARGDLDAVGPSSDVYGLGALLFACLTGQPPIRTDSLQANLDCTIRGERRPPSSINARVDPDLDAICARCLARDPAERYPSAEAVAGALSAYLEGQPLTAPRSSWLVPALVAVVLALTGLLGLLVVRGGPGSTPKTPQASAPLPAPTGTTPAPPTHTSPKPTPEPKPTRTAPETLPVRPEDLAAANALVKRARVLMRGRKFTEAVKLLSQAIALAPSSPQHLIWIGIRGYCYRVSGAFRDALHDLTAYIDGNPGDARPYFDRGLAHFGLRQFEACLSDMNKALKLDPKLAPARYWRAMSRLQKGAQTEEVLPDVEAFVREQRPPHPDLKGARKLLELLKKRR